IEDHTDHVLEHIPARATAWGSVMYGIEAPSRIQLVQVAEGLALMPRVPPADRSALAPEYLIWGYPETRDNTLIVLAGGDSLFNRLTDLVPGNRYRLTSIVRGAPYGATRIYQRTTNPSPSPPLVSVYDSERREWLGKIDRPLTASFAAVPPVTLQI